MLQLQHARRLTCVNVTRGAQRSTHHMSRSVGRRIIASIAIVAGALLLWLSPEAVLGMVMLAAGIALEAIGIRMDHAS